MTDEDIIEEEEERNVEADDSEVESENYGSCERAELQIKRRTYRI